MTRWCFIVAAGAELITDDLQKDRLRILVPRTPRHSYSRRLHRKKIETIVFVLWMGVCTISHIRAWFLVRRTLLQNLRRVLVELDKQASLTHKESCQAIMSGTDILFSSIHQWKSIND